MKAIFRDSVRRLIRIRPVSRALSGLIQVALRADPSLVGSLGLAHRLGLFNLTVSKQTESLLSRIPSETFLAERLLLYHFFRDLWPGTKNVLEIGPLLGGSTCAIGLGMAHNPRRRKGCKLFTHDFIFGSSIDDHLWSYLEKVVRSDEFSKQARQRIQKAHKFSDAFEAIHGDTDYFDLLVTCNSRLPQVKEELASTENLLILEDERRFDAVFVDGCKSWFATKHFMCEALGRVSAGSFFLFQDYGYYQTFWVAAFVAAFKENFNLLASAHNTYVFVLSKELSRERIEQSFPDDVAAGDGGYLHDLFSALSTAAEARGDHYGAFAHRLQLAAAMAYIGDKQKARVQIESARQYPYLSRYDKLLIKGVSRQPTYRPDRLPIDL